MTTTQRPLPTPPLSERSSPSSPRSTDESPPPSRIPTPVKSKSSKSKRSKSNSKPSPTIPTTTQSAFYPSHEPTRTTSDRLKSKSFIFPAAHRTPSGPAALNSDASLHRDFFPDDTPRPRYYSTVSQYAVPKSDSSGKLTGKLKSLRKKIETELSRKRGAPSRNLGRDERRANRKAQQGTVAGLRPSPALTVPEGMTVADASQLCAAKRTDCVLVVDEEEGLSGIFTAKDLAFRVTAEGLDPRLTTVAQIMTKNPMVTRDTTSATEALQLMVSRGFRHLPVCNEDGDVVGLLDITKVFHEALAKVERGSSATSQLSAALAGVQSELGPGMASNPQAAAMMAYVDSLREKMSLPDLTTVLDPRMNPPIVTPRTTVRDAAKLMKERRTTAVCVMESNNGSSVLSGASGAGGHSRIAGIFTSKDIVLRVIAAGLDATRCSVVRVMTPHPDTAPPNMIVQDALKKMHNGHYLNLPVVDDDGRLMGIVDVLKLTYATLEQIESMSEEQENGTSGPVWGKFFEAINAGGDDGDTASEISHSRPDTPSRSFRHRALDSIASPMSEVTPNDSASVAGFRHDDGASEIARHVAASSVAPPSVPTDDGTYIFKFRTPSGRTHRFQARHDNFELLRDIVAGKLATDPFFRQPMNANGDNEVAPPDPNVFSVSYTDDDGDLVTITADADVSDAVKIARGKKTDRVVLLIDGGKLWEDAARDAGGDKAVEKLKAMEQEVNGVEKEEEKMEKASADPAKVPTWGKRGIVHAHGAAEELIGGVLPKDMVLPAAVGFLGVVILGVFIAGRASK
ncbi:hypothetical protein BD324DRAFT_581734 [Kockovaella imperatae]|uniref:CBS domain-containing protein n=1 Tax=Kockovaella imperatae TaxID=4999 RepID=A0A1Y1UF64_9TREE|nr:hypothetical protein BD324DRAFT_581734 [Kockovaella imperatae]ORX35715.1 hypothetical protein BD324DRAFT_581734 [Kockovaella imperatae]